jgi:phospholipid-binding lipoprotein MlaA
MHNQVRMSKRLVPIINMKNSGIFFRLSSYIDGSFAKSGSAPLTIESRQMTLSDRIPAAIALCLLLSGCAGMRMTDTGDVYDPLEKENRALFGVTLQLDRAIIRPVAVGYRSVLPMVVRDSIRNFINNLDSPVVFANDVLQGDVDRAGTTLLRLGVNTTIGIGGLFDPATRLGYARHSGDFGLTLATYGVGEGAYLFIPILGPSNVRDLTGYGVDFLFDPFTYFPLRENFYWQTGRQALDDIDLRARNIETLDEVEKTSLDFYASLRSLYHQERESQIRHGAPEIQNLPNF